MQRASLETKEMNNSVRFENTLNKIVMNNAFIENESLELNQKGKQKTAKLNQLNDSIGADSNDSNFNWLNNKNDAKHNTITNKNDKVRIGFSSRKKQKTRTKSEYRMDTSEEEQIKDRIRTAICQELKDLM